MKAAGQDGQRTAKSNTPKCRKTSRRVEIGAKKVENCFQTQLHTTGTIGTTQHIGTQLVPPPATTHTHSHTHTLTHTHAHTHTHSDSHSRHRHNGTATASGAGFR